MAPATVPARAQALDVGRIQAAPFSFIERLDLEQRGFPVLFDIGKAMPKFPFVVLLTSKRKAETAPDEIVTFLKIMKRSMDIIRTDKDRVVAAIVKKGTFGDPRTRSEGCRSLLGILFHRHHQRRR